MQSEVDLVNLEDLVKLAGEDRTKSILSGFSCKINPAIETFLKEKAIEFSNRGFARTHLMLFKTNSSWNIAGYFSLANKTLFVENELLSRTKIRQLKPFSQEYVHTDRLAIAAPSIAQFGKNDYSSTLRNIKGSELFQVLINKIIRIQYQLGGRITFLECENIEKLIGFYQDQGFTICGDRMANSHDQSRSPTILIQMIRYLPAN